MNPLAFFFPKPRWSGCTPPTATERMARYSARHAAEIQQRENEGAGLPRVQLRDGHLVLVALPGRVNNIHPIKDTP